MEKNNISGFTLSEVVLATSLAGIVFVTVGFLWYFLVSSLSTEGRLEEVRQEIVYIMTQMDTDVSYRAIGSVLNPGLVNCSAPCGGAPCVSGDLFALRYDSNNNFKADTGDVWIIYRLSGNTLDRCYAGSCSQVSDKVVSVSVSEVPSGAACGSYFMLNVNLICRYDPTKPKSADNPEVAVSFVLSANQVSVK